MIKISNICLHQNSIFIKFLKILKIHEFFCENPRIDFVLFYDVHKENMFTINLEDGRKKYALLIATNLTSICCVYKEKVVKTTYTEERSVHTNSESCNIQLGS